MKKIIIILLTVLFTLGGCNKQKIKFKKTSRGEIEYYFVKINKNNPQPETGGGAIIEVKAFWKDSLMFNSKEISPDFAVMIKSKDSGTIDKALTMMHEDDSAIFKLNAVKFLTQTANAAIPGRDDALDQNDFLHQTKKVLTPTTSSQTA